MAALYAEIVKRHDEAIQLYGGDFGMLSQGLLESAITRPWTEFGGVVLFNSPFEKAAAICEAVARNHAFLDGNKRTALISADLVLGIYGLAIDATTQEKVDTILGLVERRLTFEDFVRWLEGHYAPA